LISLPKRNHAVKCKWIYKMKDNDIFNTRLAAKEFAQRKIKEYDAIVALVVHHTSIRILLAILASQDLEFKQLDVKTVFLR
jgi:hypothetical protein